MNLFSLDFFENSFLKIYTTSPQSTNLTFYFLKPKSQKNFNNLGNNITSKTNLVGYSLL
jgi:hypothetical protein